MTPVDKLQLYLKIQQIILDDEESSELISSVLPKILQELNNSGFAYQFISAIFLDDDKKITHEFFVDSVSLKNNPEYVSKFILAGKLFQDEEYISVISKGGVIVTDQVAKCLNGSQFDVQKIKSVIISPITISKKLYGVCILGSEKEFKKISLDERELIDMLSNLISLSFRLQDTQNSLTQITQEVYKANAQLHQLDKLKDDFVSVASHELRTPMTAIRSYAWMVLNRPDIPISEKMRRYLDRVLVSTERLINLVNDMLNISRIEGGRIEVSPKEFDMRILVKDVVEEVSVKASERSIKLEIEETQVPMVFADPEKVHEVLLNLIGNSMKFTPSNGEINIHFFSDGIMLEVTVKDNGVGISKEDLSRLFKKFGRLDNSYVSMATSGGTGLGLYISKSLIELMKGKIWATSDGQGTGSSFTFSLPVATAQVLKEAEKYVIKPDGGEVAKPLERAVI